MRKSARRIFCRFCGAAGAHRHGLDARRRARFKCTHCGRTFIGRTNTVRSGSHLNDDEWMTATRMFSLRAGMSGRDIARFFGWNEKTGQRLNRVFRVLVLPLLPQSIPGASEWDESLPLSDQWVLGGVSRDVRRCLLQCIPDRSERILCPLVRSAVGAEGLVFTDEWGGYNDLYRRMTVCHAREFVNSQVRFVHTNTIEGVWGHLKPLGWHIYRGFPRSSLPQFLGEFMFRYNYRHYENRVSVLSALISRKSHTLLV